MPQGLLDSESLAFVRSFRDVSLFCRDRAGRPIGYPMRTLACDESSLTFTTYRKSAKVRNIERDPRVCVLASDLGRSRPRWVSVSGRARVVTPSEGDLQAMFPPGSGDGRVPEGMSELVAQRLRDGKRILLRIESLRTAGVCAPPAA